MNKFIKKDLGKNAVSTYKRASNILEQEKSISKNGPDAVLFKYEEEKELLKKSQIFEKLLLLETRRKIMKTT